MTATQVGYRDERVKLYELQSQGDRIPGAFFRMKSGVTKGRKKKDKGEKVCRPVTRVFRAGHPDTELIVVGGSWLVTGGW